MMATPTIGDGLKYANLQAAAETFPYDEAAAPINHRARRGIPVIFAPPGHQKKGADNLRLEWG